MIIILLILIGIFVGVLGAVLGLGGGIIIVPILSLGLNMPIHEAIASSLVIITANSLSTSAVYIRNGMANINLGILLASAAVLGSIIGSFISLSLDQNIVFIIIACIQLIVAFLTFIRGTSNQSYVPAKVTDNSIFNGKYLDKATNTIICYKPIRIWYNSIFAGFSGVFAGLSGAGGGIFIIPGMNVISHMPIKAATATSTFIMGFTATSAAIIYTHAGYVNSKYVAGITLGIFLGTAISLRYFSKITDKKVSYIFIILLLLVSLQMFYKGITL